MSDLVITIDGPAGSGKSTVARLLAERLGASFLDTGAMYRAVTLAAMQAGVDMEREDELLGVLDSTEFKFTEKEGKMLVSINGIDVTEQIRQREVTANAHYVASAVKLREQLVEMQREFAGGEEKIVTEGRDQGTVAFADADVKFFLTADIDERAKRRFADLRSDGIKVSVAEVRADIEKRDRSDESRDVGPLKPAEDAVIVDTTDIGAEEVVDKLLDYIEKNG